MKPRSQDSGVRIRDSSASKERRPQDYTGPVYSLSLSTYAQGYERAGEGAPSTARGGQEKATRRTEAVNWTERTEGLVENKAVSFLGRKKRIAFSGQKTPIHAKNMAKNSPLVGHFPVCAHPDEPVYPRRQLQIHVCFGR